MDYYRNKKILITGGLGFIGSTLAQRLVKMESDICIVDSLVPDYGGNNFNIDGIVDKVTVNIADVRDKHSMDYLVKDKDIIFNLAGTLSHIDSMRDPFTDLEINCKSQLSILESCRINNKDDKIVFRAIRQS
jgi:UDP-glucose 4-epimerase